ALLAPAVVREEREPLADVGVLLVDRSASTAVTGRGAAIDRAAAAIVEAAGRLPGLALRVVEVPAGPDRLDRETRLIEALDQATADLPLSRLAGAVLLTD